MVHRHVEQFGLQPVGKMSVVCDRGEDVDSV